VPKGWDFPVNAKILRIGVPVRREFKFFVNVEANHNTNGSSVSGYSIDVFEAAVNRLPYALRYEYIPYDCANSYDQLISQVYFKVSLSLLNCYHIFFPCPMILTFLIPPLVFPYWMTEV